LERRETRLLGLSLEPEAREVDDAVAELEARGRGRRRLGVALLVGALAADVRADARDELADAEGLRHVVVGPELEAEHLVALVSARREEDHGRVRAGLLLLVADLLQELEARHAREDDVED